MNSHFIRHIQMVDHRRQPFVLILNPDRAFTASSLATEIEAMYREPSRFADLKAAAALVSFLLAGTGLVSLESYMLARRTREIGVRKALGATTQGMIALLSREMIVWVAVANLVAWPAAYLLMSDWLENYMYRIEISLLEFVGIGLASLLLAQAVVSYHAIRAARLNPVTALRHE